MWVEFFEKRSTTIYAGLCFAFPVLLGTVKNWHSGLFLLACLFGVFSLKGISWHEIPKELKVFFYAVVIFLIACLVSLLNADDLYQGVKRITKLSYLLGFFVLAASAGRVRADLSRYYLRGIYFGAFVLLGVATYQTFFLGMERAQGITHPIVFGNVGMLFGGLLFISALYKPGRAHWLLSGLALGAALTASLLSGSRGGWLALPIVLVFVPMVAARTPSVRRKRLIFSVVILMMVGVAIGFSERMDTRINQAFSDVKSFTSGQNLNTSLGQRFLMWKIAWEQFQRHPLIGSGIGDFKHDSIDAMETGESQLNYERSHAHNIFFEMLGNTGLLGLLSMLMAIIVVPFVLFYKGWENAGSENQRRVALSGLLIVVFFVIFGFSESWISRSPFMIFYSFSLSVFYSSLRFLKKLEKG